MSLNIPPRTLEAITNPEWERVGRVHDWRNYISEILQDNWDSLSEETRLVAYSMAGEQASSEEWDL